MPNLHNHDVLFLHSKELDGFIGFLEDSYGFIIESCSLPPNVSFTSRKAIVHTNKGTFFLKEKPQYCSELSDLQRSVEFQVFLSQCTAIVPSVLPTVDGAYYIIWQNTHFFLTVFKEGRTFNGSDKDIQAMLKAVKTLYDAAAIFTEQYKQFGYIDSYDVIPDALVLSRYASSVSEHVILQRVARIKEKVKARYHTIEEKEYSINHGDLSIFNMLLDQNGVVAINDFDNVQCLPRVHDLAEFLVTATLVHYQGAITNLQRPVFTQPSDKKFMHILNFYARAVHIKSSSAKLLAVIAEIVWLEILLLAVLKEDYSLTDIVPAIDCIEGEDLSKSIQYMLRV